MDRVADVGCSVLLVATSVGIVVVCLAKGQKWLGLGVLSALTLAFLVPSNVLKVVLVSLMVSVFHYVMGRETLPARDKAILITGCDSGLGHKLAKFLDSRGLRVFAGVLDELSPGALHLKSSASSNLTVLQLDVTNPVQITQAHRYVQSQTSTTGLWALINNAGILGYVCDGEILPLRLYKKYLDVNFIGCVEVTQTFLPLIRQAKGRILSISSMAGEVPLPGLAAYGASKAALNTFSGTIRQELSRWGVRVIVIQPGAFKTNILGSSEQWNSVQTELVLGLPRSTMASYGEDYISSMRQRLASMSSSSSSDLRHFLSDVQHALLSPRPRRFYYPGAAAWLLPLLYRLCPASLSDRLLSKTFLRGSVQPAELSDR